MLHYLTPTYCIEVYNRDGNRIHTIDIASPVHMPASMGVTRFGGKLSRKLNSPGALNFKANLQVNVPSAQQENCQLNAPIALLPSEVVSYMLQSITITVCKS